MTGSPGPRDEARHDGAAAGSRWCEVIAFDGWRGDAAAGAQAALVLWPGRRVGWYWSTLVQSGEPVLLVVDATVPLPRSRWEIRADGLWADHICEEPLARWTIGNEAHAVALDDPEEALRRAFGDAAAIAFDLEWEATGPAAGLASPQLRADHIASAEGSIAGYVVPAGVHGVIERHGGALTVDSWTGRWTHAWGHDAWTALLGEPGTEVGAAGTGILRAPVLLDGEAVEQRLTPAGWSRWRRPPGPPSPGGGA